MLLDKRKVHVTPKDLDAVHTDHRQLVAIKNHQYYFVNLKTGKIVYRKRPHRWRTGKTTIRDAKEYVENRLEMMRTGKSEETIKRESEGVISPLLKVRWDELMGNKEFESAKNTKINYRKSWRIGFGGEQSNHCRACNKKWFGEDSHCPRCTSDLIDFVPKFWGGKTEADLTPANIQKYKNWYLEHYPKRYFNQTFVHFGMLLRYMVAQKYLTEMPDISELETINDTTNKNSQRKAPHRFIKADERVAIFKAVDNYHDTTRAWGTTTEHKEALRIRVRTALLFYFNTGCRKMEFLSAKWEKVNWETSEIELWSFKNLEWRTVPMVPEVVEALRLQQTLTGHTEFIFPMPTDPTRHISGQIFDHIWTSIKSLAGIVGRLRVHDIRHTFATITGEEGWPPMVAIGILDMSLKTYESVYCKPSMLSKWRWMNLTFGKPPGKKD